MSQYFHESRLYDLWFFGTLDTLSTSRNNSHIFKLLIYSIPLHITTVGRKVERKVFFCHFSCQFILMGTFETIIVCDLPLLIPLIGPSDVQPRHCSQALQFSAELPIFPFSLPPASVQLTCRFLMLKISP